MIRNENVKRILGRAALLAGLPMGVNGHYRGGRQRALFSTKIAEVLPETLVIPALSGRTKDEVLRELVEHMARQFSEIEPERLLEILWERERLSSTAIRGGIAIPHGKFPGLQAIRGAFGRHLDGIDFQSPDGHLTRLFFLLVAPSDTVGQHLTVLARASMLLKDRNVRDRLLTRQHRAEIYRDICGEEEITEPEPTVVSMHEQSASGVGWSVLD